ncbi:hypothetical protein Tco_0217921 [Tanacetum coccineum]
MDNPNLTMEEYVRLEEEKARKRGKVFDWKTATYEKIRVDDDFNDLRSMEAEFPAIVINDDFAPKNTLQCKSQVKNDYKEVMPSILSPELVISCFDDLDFFKDFENEFPAIIYNDAQMSKSDLLTEPILNPQHIDEFDLNDETSLSEYDEEEQNVLYFNDLFPFNIIRSDDLKSEKDNDNNEIDITQSLLDNEITHGSTMLFETSHDKVTKTLRMENFVINLNVKIMIWIYYANGMLFYINMNLCATFAVPFDPKRYYKDGDCTIMLRRPRLCFIVSYFDSVELFRRSFLYFLFLPSPSSYSSSYLFFIRTVRPPAVARPGPLTSSLRRQVKRLSRRVYPALRTFRGDSECLSVRERSKLSSSKRFCAEYLRGLRSLNTTVASEQAYSTSATRGES